MDTFNDADDRKDWVNKDVYGVLRKEMEVDSDVNEDSNREQQLDDSFQDWYRNIGYWVQQKENMTQVPKANVFDDIPELETE
ncbi:hypothetical protein BK138_13930 [Paenibacillus rhizosphaerae]|uniref:Uncharacterized protein n=1 Tax=Paenibacillus rhizosphaerae TaxID=297318 RepID=A0A1R1ER87_9BACL|nr:hypothetical protein [Paenibacillus rhizosphaerae]OMF54289.1 hypothetical protein BK138_13930 [Paenibacillus rhizosphaerae]